jgi:hypothetical protein
MRRPASVNDFFVQMVIKFYVRSERRRGAAIVGPLSLISVGVSEGREAVKGALFARLADP